MGTYGYGHLGLVRMDTLEAMGVACLGYICARPRDMVEKQKRLQRVNKDRISNMDIPNTLYPVLVSLFSVFCPHLGLFRAVL